MALGRANPDGKRVVKRRGRPWEKKRPSYRDGWPLYCHASILVPEPAYRDVAVRVLPCRRERGHTGLHRGNRQAGWWSDDEAKAMDELWAAHNRWIGGTLRYLGRQSRQPGFRR